MFSTQILKLALCLSIAKANVFDDCIQTDSAVSQPGQGSCSSGSEQCCFLKVKKQYDADNNVDGYKCFTWNFLDQFSFEKVDGDFNYEGELTLELTTTRNGRHAGTQVFDDFVHVDCQHAFTDYTEHATALSLLPVLIAISLSFNSI